MWEVEALGRVHRIHKGQFPGVAEGHADRAVLVARALRVERRRVVVEGLPVARVVVPVEARASRLRLEAEEVAHFLLDLLVPVCGIEILRRVHAIDATPARWRGDAGSSPLEHPTHWLISTQVAGPDHFVDQVVSHLTLTKGYPADCVVYF